MTEIEEISNEVAKQAAITLALANARGTSGVIPNAVATAFDATKPLAERASAAHKLVDYVENHQGGGQAAQRSSELTSAHDILAAYANQLSAGNYR